MRGYLAVFSLLLYSVLAAISMLPQAPILQNFQAWVLGEDSSFEYANFYWTFSYVSLIIIHRSFLGTNRKNTMTMLLVLCFLLITTNILAAETAKIDGYLLTTPSMLIGLVMISSTMLNNHSLKHFDRLCQLVSLTNLEDKNRVDFIHSLVFAIGIGICYAIFSS